MSDVESLSGYRFMWMVVMFDLPVTTAKERKAATDFRHALLDMGFGMAQYSVYMRYCSSQTQVETYCKQVERNLPEGGKVDILQFTDKQYEKIISFMRRKRGPKKKSSDQYELF